MYKEVTFPSLKMIGRLHDYAGKKYSFYFFCWEQKPLMGKHDIYWQ